jgi:hypothetical protein
MQDQAGEVNSTKACITNDKTSRWILSGCYHLTSYNENVTVMLCCIKLHERVCVCVCVCVCMCVCEMASLEATHVHHTQLR